jgi:hypothetical protein
MGGRTGRWWWAATGITLIVWALELFSGVSELAWIAAVVVVLMALGLATIVVSLRPVGTLPASDQRRHRSHASKIRTWWWSSGRRHAAAIGPWAIALAVVAGFIVWSFLQIRNDPSYSTDEVAFDQYAATLAVHGQNPYSHSMEPAFGLYHLSPNGATFRLDGTEVTALSYPALSFEAYLPFLALGWSSQLAVGLNVISWAVAILLLFGMLPKPIRASALVILSLSTYTGYAVGGVTDALFVPLLLGAAYFWERSASGRGRVWLSPVFFGLAMAVKQTPWLILPFAVVGIAAEYRARRGRWGFRAGAVYLTIALGAFLLPNLFYLVQAPGKWFTGVVTPFVNHTVPAGQGLIGLSLFLHVGGGALSLYTVVAVVALVSMLAVYVTSYPLLRGWTFVIPSLILFFATRSFGSYLVMLAPVAFLAVARSFAVHDPSSDDLIHRIDTGNRLSQFGIGGGQPWRLWPLVGVLGALSTGVAIFFTLTSSSPLRVSITNVRTTGQLATIERITVAVHNNSNRSLRPAFTIESGGVITAFWRVIGANVPILPGKSESLTLLSPNFGAQPAISGGFSVAAFTSSPDAVSTSNVFLPTTWHVALLPESVPRAVPLNHKILIHAELLDKFDRRVRISQIPVYLGQIIYDQHGLIYSSAVVNGAPPGRTPVSAVTDKNGKATFTIEGTHTAPDPVYFEANLVDFSHFYPYGYSDIVAIRFADSS